MTINLVMAFIVVLILAVGVLTGGTMTSNAMASAVTGDNSDGDNVENDKETPVIPQHIEPTNVATWPNGDRIWDCCRAIAYAEGYNVAGSNPARLNNPGDLSDGMDTFGSEFHSGSNITKFPTATTGWSWLYAKLKRAAYGQSQVYDPSMSWREIGAIWAPPNAEVWAANVARNLGVDPDTSLGDYVNG